MGTLYINGKPLDVGSQSFSPSLQNCDYCEEWKTTTGGKMVYLPGEVEGSQGEAVAWFCADCLRK